MSTWVAELLKIGGTFVGAFLAKMPNIILLKSVV